MTYSIQTNAPRCAVVSAQVDGLTSVENAKRHRDLVAHCAVFGVAFQECTGRFDGRIESGVLIVGQESTDRALELARHYGQDSFLAVSENDRGAYLVDSATGFYASVGKLRNVGPNAPAGDYTAVNGWHYQASAPVGVNLPDGFDGGDAFGFDTFPDAIDILAEAEGF